MQSDYKNKAHSYRNDMTEKTTLTNAEQENKGLPYLNVCAFLPLLDQFIKKKTKKKTMVSNLTVAV